MEVFLSLMSFLSKFKASRSENGRCGQRKVEFTFDGSSTFTSTVTQGQSFNSWFLVFRDWKGIALDVRFKFDLTEADFCLRDISLGESLSNFQCSPKVPKLFHNVRLSNIRRSRIRNFGEQSLTRYLPNFFIFISTFNLLILFWLRKLRINYKLISNDLLL